MTEDGADLYGYHLNAVYHKIRSVYRGNLHRNDGNHIYGGVANDAVWLRRWRHIRHLTTRLYNALTGHIGCRFVKLLIMELKGVRNREWGFYSLLVFSDFVLSISGTVRSSKEIITMTQIQLDLWDQGGYMALVDDMFTSGGGMGSGNQPRASPEVQEEWSAQDFNHTLLPSCLRQVVRRATGRKGG